ncbi:MAG: hypothetical protein R3321_00875 [Nitrososphaeraceae archaeon]|nr:hypothetical protein [Nitrososphaeraceae archaeon]
MAKRLVELDITLDGVILSRLMLKDYEKAYTDLPNANLPTELYEDFSTVFTALTGEESMPLTDNTFTISAKESEVDESLFEFNRLYSPTVFKHVSDEDGTEPYLFIQWGSYEVKLLVDDDGTISTERTGLQLKLRNKKLGKYDTPCLVATVKTKDTTVSMPFPIRTTDLETGADELELYLESDVDTFMSSVGAKSSGGGNFKSFSGYTVKAGQLPLGEYEIVDYRSYDHPQYGVRYYLQAAAPNEPFSASVGIKDENGEWSNNEVEINDLFQIRSNSSIKRYMDANPIINSDSPATLVVHEKGEFNGHATAKVVMKFNALAEDDEAIDLNF